MQSRYYAIWITPTGRVPLLHGPRRKSTLAFPSVAEAERALEKRGRKMAVDTRGEVYVIPAEGSAFDYEPVLTIAL